MTTFAKSIRFYVNPKAKYLSNTVENLLYNIGKSDRSSLAWQTCRTNMRSLNNNRKFNSQHDVPLTRRVSSILKVPGVNGWKRDEVEKAERRKNIFYQILKATQDVGDDNGIRSYHGPSNRQMGGLDHRKPKDARIFNEIYDIVKGYLNKPTNIEQNPFLLANSSSINTQPVKTGHTTHVKKVYKPHPSIPVYKVHQKKKTATKKPKRIRKSKRALPKKRRTRKYKGKVQFGKTFLGARSQSGSKIESIAGSQQSGTSMSRVFDSTILLNVAPRMDNNWILPTDEDKTEQRLSIIPSTSAYIAERRASQETVYSIPEPSQRIKEETTDISKPDILKSPRASTESEVSKESQRRFSSVHVRSVGSRIECKGLRRSQTSILGSSRLSKTREPIKRSKQQSVSRRTSQQSITSALLPPPNSQASRTQKFNQKNIHSIKNRSLAPGKQGRKFIKKSGLSRLPPVLALKTPTRHKTKRITDGNSFHTKRKIFSLLPEDIFVNEKRKQIIDQMELDDANHSILESYEQRLSKLQRYLSDGHSGHDLDDLTLDGINIEELLLYPYQFAEKKSKHSRSHSHSHSHLHSPSPEHQAPVLPVTRPVKRKKAITKKSSKLLNQKPLKNESGCCICKQIHRNVYQKDAPFIAKMKRESKRQELKAYLLHRQINEEKRKLQDYQDDQIIRQTVTICHGVPHCIRVKYMREKPILLVE